MTAVAVEDILLFEDDVPTNEEAVIIPDGLFTLILLMLAPVPSDL